MSRYKANSFKVNKVGKIFGITYYTIEIDGEMRIDKSNGEPALYTIKQIVELMQVYSK